MISRFAMDASSEFLFGHNAHTLAAGLPYPFSSSPSSPQAAESSSASTEFAAALNRAQLVSAERGMFGGAWPLLLEFWRDRIRAPMGVVRAFLDPILTEAVARKRASGEKVISAGEREVQEGETLVEHLLNYTEGESIILQLTPLSTEIVFTYLCADRMMLRDEVLNISVAGRDTVRLPSFPSSFLMFPISRRRPPPFSPSSSTCSPSTPPRSLSCARRSSPRSAPRVRPRRRTSAR